MNNFSQLLQSWQPFYATVATASATLTGLLFVSLSINRHKLDAVSIATARRTFASFLDVVVIALSFLVPFEEPLAFAISFFMFGLTRSIGLVYELVNAIKTRTYKKNAPSIIRGIGLPILSSAGMIVVAIAIYEGKMSAMYWPVGVVLMALIAACQNAWALLMKE
jgi:hypothetical protein